MPKPKSALPRDDTIPGDLIRFQERFRTERSCEKVLRRWKYGDVRFRCPACGCEKGWYLASRRLDECSQCDRQTSLTAGTVFHKSTTSLRKWFLAIHLFTSGKQGISAMALSRAVGITYPTAWAWLQKLRSAVGQRSVEQLHGIIEVDETLEGGRDVGGKPGRGARRKSVVAGAVELGADDRGFGRCRLAHVADASARSLGAFLEEQIAAGSAVLTDGWRGYSEQATVGVDHFPVDVRPTRRPAHEVLPGIHRVFSLLGRVLLTTYQGAVRPKYLSLYLAEFEFRFNRRHSKSRGLLFQRALSASVVRAPPTYWEIIGRANPRRIEAA